MFNVVALDVKAPLFLTLYASFLQSKQEHHNVKETLEFFRKFTPKKKKILSNCFHSKICIYWLLYKWMGGVFCNMRKSSYILFSSNTDFPYIIMDWFRIYERNYWVKARPEFLGWISANMPTWFVLGSPQGIDLTNS